MDDKEFLYQCYADSIRYRMQAPCQQCTLFICILFYKMGGEAQLLKVFVINRLFQSYSRSMHGEKLNTHLYGIVFSEMIMEVLMKAENHQVFIG